MAFFSAWALGTGLALFVKKDFIWEIHPLLVPLIALVLLSCGRSLRAVGMGTVGLISAIAGIYTRLIGVKSGVFLERINPVLLPTLIYIGTFLLSLSLSLLMFHQWFVVEGEIAPAVRLALPRNWKRGLIFVIGGALLAPFAASMEVTPLLTAAAPVSFAITAGVAALIIGFIGDASYSLILGGFFGIILVSLLNLAIFVTRGFHRGYLRSRLFYSSTMGFLVSFLLLLMTFFSQGALQLSPFITLSLLIGVFTGGIVAGKTELRMGVGAYAHSYLGWLVLSTWLGERSLGSLLSRFMLAETIIAVNVLSVAELEKRRLQFKDIFALTIGALASFITGYMVTPEPEEPLTVRTINLFKDINWALVLTIAAIIVAINVLQLLFPTKVPDPVGIALAPLIAKTPSPAGVPLIPLLIILLTLFKVISIKVWKETGTSTIYSGLQGFFTGILLTRIIG